MPNYVPKYDLVSIYKDDDGDYRWTRKTTTNHRVVGASTQGYSALIKAIDNIDRTQKTPFTLNFNYKKEEIWIFVDD